MKGLVYLILLSAFMLGACAHLDNGFLRSAEPLPKGDSRGFASVSSSYCLTSASLRLASLVPRTSLSVRSGIFSY